MKLPLDDLAGALERLAECLLEMAGAVRAVAGSLAAPPVQGALPPWGHDGLPCQVIEDDGLPDGPGFPGAVASAEER